MKDLIQHLENLLPEHDCVVVPGLGGFVQNEVSARIQPGARLFYPASKEIGFNPRLKFNDGLLAQSYQEINTLSFEEANAAILAAVQEIQEKLEAGKFIRLGRTGTLFMIEQQLIFRPDHHNHFYPEAYGLTTFTFPLLNKPHTIDENVSAPTTQPEVEKEMPREPIKSASKRKEGRDEFIHIRFSRSRARQLFVAAAVFLFLLLFSKPAGVPSGNQEAGMLHNYLSVSSHVLPVSTKVQNPIIPLKDSALTEPKTHASVPAPGIQKDPSVKPTVPASGIQYDPSVKSTRTVSESASHGYYIIVSAFLRKSSAQRWIREHEGESFIKNVGIIQAEGHARVYVKNFPTEEDANKFLNEFTSSHSEYASAWVYSSKND